MLDENNIHMVLEKNPISQIFILTNITLLHFIQTSSSDTTSGDKLNRLACKPLSFVARGFICVSDEFSKLRIYRLGYILYFNR